MRGLVLPTMIALLLAAPLLWRIDSELDMPNQAIGEWQGEDWATTPSSSPEGAVPRRNRALPEGGDPASAPRTPSLAGLTPVERAKTPARD